MTYIIIKVGDETAFFANSDCYVRVLLDWLREKLEHLLPQMPVDLDLCDDSGNMRMLSELPPTASATLTLQMRGTYHPVVRFLSHSASFRLLQPPGTPEKQRELQLRLSKCCATWHHFKQRLPKHPPFERLLDCIQKSMTKSAKGPASEAWDRLRERSLSSRRDRKSPRSDSANSDRKGTGYSLYPETRLSVDISSERRDRRTPHS